MTFTPFPHQIEGAEFLSSAYGTTRGLFFGMGTGKTYTSLLAFNRSVANRLLVIGPPISLPMWVREVEAHVHPIRPNKVQLLKTGTTKINPDTTTLVMSYDIARKRAEELRQWADKDCTALICDESHALKSSKAKRTQAILGRDGVASGCAYSWMLTGTPITRWNDDMFPFLCRADIPGLKQRTGGVSLEKFQLRYTIRQEREFRNPRFPARKIKTKLVVGNRNTEELAGWIYGDRLALRVDLNEVYKAMPPLTTNRYTVPISANPELKAKLKKLEKLSPQEIRNRLQSPKPGDDEVALATVRRELGLAMVDSAFKEITDRLEAGVNVLVGAWHTDVIDQLEKRLLDAGHSVGVIDGRATANLKSMVEKNWNDGALRVVIAQIAAAGVSLNLQQGGHHIIVVEEDWSPSIMDQFYARLWRYGQEKHVHVDILTTDYSLSKALRSISGTKTREHARFNQIGNEVRDE